MKYIGNDFYNRKIIGLHLTDKLFIYTNNYIENQLSLKLKHSVYGWVFARLKGRLLGGIVIYYENN